MHALDGHLVPILIRVEQWVEQLAKHAATFEAALNWVDAFLELTCNAPYCGMLRQVSERQQPFSSGHSPLVLSTVHCPLSTLH